MVHVEESVSNVHDIRLRCTLNAALNLVTPHSLMKQLLLSLNRLQVKATIFYCVKMALDIFFRDNESYEYKCL